MLRWSQRRREPPLTPTHRRGPATPSCVQPTDFIVACRSSSHANSFQSRRETTGSGSETATACTTSRPMRPNEEIPSGTARPRPIGRWRPSGYRSSGTAPTRTGSSCGCTESGVWPGGRPSVGSDRPSEHPRSTRAATDLMAPGIAGAPPPVCGSALGSTFTRSCPSNADRSFRWTYPISPNTRVILAASAARRGVAGSVPG